MKKTSFKDMKEVMNHINTIAEEYRNLSDQLNNNVISTYNELESKEELSQEQILSIAIDETDEIMFHVEDTNGPDFIFSEDEIESIENLVVKSSLDRGILIEQIKQIKNKQRELEQWLDYKRYRLKARNEKINYRHTKK
ncbi:MAG: hypothetical protein ACLFQM_01575 [Fidelibacterota bacterium]